jgi:hypothetical protein
MEVGESTSNSREGTRTAVVEQEGTRMLLRKVTVSRCPIRITSSSSSSRFPPLPFASFSSSFLYCRYNAPQQFGGQGQYPQQQYAPPSGPPPMH